MTTGVLGVLAALVSLLMIGSTSPVAILLQTACLLWVIALVLRVVNHWLAYVAAGAWAIMLWLPMCAQVVRRLHYWITIGMEPPDGTGSPMAFLIGFVFEWLVLLPLTALIVFLVRAKPWRERTTVLRA